MAKRKEDLKKIVSIAISPKQHCDLKDLAKYTGLSLSEIVRDLIPTKEEIAAFTSLKVSGYGKAGKNITELITETHKTYFAALMGGSILYNIGLHSAAVFYFDKTGNDTFKLFSNWVKAIQKKKGYRFVTFFKAKGFSFMLLVTPNESKAKIEKLIDQFMMQAPNEEQLNALKMSRRKPVRLEDLIRSRIKKKKNKSNLKTKKK